MVSSTSDISSLAMLSCHMWLMCILHVSSLSVWTPKHLTLVFTFTSFIFQTSLPILDITIDRVFAREMSTAVVLCETGNSTWFYPCSVTLKHWTQLVIMLRRRMASSVVNFVLTKPSLMSQTLIHRERVWSTLHHVFWKHYATICSVCEQKVCSTNSWCQKNFFIL